MGSYYLMGQVSVWMTKTFWKWIVVMVAQQCEILNATEQYTFKKLKWYISLCIFHHKNFFFFNIFIGL